jgi:hypothetical protein
MRRIRSRREADTHTRTACGTSFRSEVAPPAAQDDGAVRLRGRDDLVGGEHAQLHLVHRQALEEALLAFQEADDVALAHARAVREVIDDLVVLDLQPERLGHAPSHVLAERADLPVHRDERHASSLRRIVAQGRGVLAYCASTPRRRD